MAWIDVERAGDLAGISRLARGGRLAPVSFRRSDHHGPSEVALAEAVRATVRDRIGADAPGPVFALAHLRTWWHCFNPLITYWCTDAAGAPVAQVLQVTNTPWGEQHAYVVDRRTLVATAPSRDARGDRAPVRFAKALHVSPFLPMDCEYELLDAPPAARVELELRVHREGSLVFDAGFVGRRRTLDAAALRHLLFVHPTHRVLAGIHVQAALLWRKGARFHSHPRRAEATR